MTPDADTLRPLHDIAAAAERVADLYHVVVVDGEPRAIEPRAPEAERRRAEAALVRLLKPALEAERAWERQHGLDLAARWIVALPPPLRSVVSQAFGLGLTVRLEGDDSVTLVDSDLGHAIHIADLTAAVNRWRASRTGMH